MNFLVLQHLRIEPTAIIGDLIKDAGHNVDIVRMDKGESVPVALDGYDGMVVMGGPMSANDAHLPYIADEIALLEKAIKADFPVLGLCLGAQLLAKAGGAEIVPSPIRELGWHPVFHTKEADTDPLFSGLKRTGLNVFQWHGETFTLPVDAALLATHPAVPNQVFRIGLSQYGLQFHIEVNEAIIESWIEAGVSECEELGEQGVALIRKESPELMPAAHGFCRDMIEAWLSIARKNS
ncbi:MAG: type 1 glutamine amidotransferase [Mariprofundaceae bacterium]